MKHKHNIIIFALMLLSISASAQIQFTAGLNYESGVPSGAPSSTGSRIRINLATGRAYIWNQAGSNWRVLAQGIDIVAGCSAPLYTPGYGQSLFAINGCASPELYYYTGTAWVQISGGGGGATYYAGEGIDITNDTISVDTVQRLSFRTDQTYSDGLGTLSWDDTNGTLQLGLKGGNVSLQLGQESVQLVKHADNTGLTKGKVVYLTGSSGSNLTVRYARANSETTSANTFGVITEDATGGNKAFCTTFGLVHNINTSNLTEGGMVWLSKDTAGAMTAVRPTAPNNGVEVGFCVTKHATNGVIFVTVQNGYELDELHNVYVPTPTNGQVLTYNTTNSRWEAATVADQSATNEIQTIDTFSLSGQTLRASLLNDGVAASSITLPIVDVVAGTNVTVTKSNGVATVSATGGGTVTGTGVAGRAAFWRSTSAISSDANFAWDSTNVQFNIGTPLSPTGRLNVRGGGTTTTVNTRLTNGNNVELLRVLDNGNTNVGTGFNWDNVNNRLGIGTASPSQTLHVAGATRIDGTNTIVDNRNNGFLTQSASTVVSNRESVWGNGGYAKLRAHTKGFYVGASFPASSYLFYVDGGTATGILDREGIYIRPTQPAAGGNTNGGDVIIELPAGTGTGRSGAVLIGTATATGPSAIVEISSTNQGLLLPRMTGAQAEAIPTPADGLLIYANNGNGAVITSVGFWGYSAGAWSKLN